MFLRYRLAPTFLVSPAAPCGRVWPCRTADGADRSPPRGKLNRMSFAPQHPSPTQSSRAHGCLLGGALGDALAGNPGHAREGSAAVPASLRFTGTTQLALYSLDGLLDALEWANAGTGADVNACIWLAYLRWYLTQEGALPPSAPAPQPRWIDGREVLHQRLDPDGTSLSGLATGEMGTSFRPVNPDAKGAAPVSRSAAFGLVPHIDSAMVSKISSDAASLTHGHPAARQAAGLFSSLIHHLCAGDGLAQATERILAAATEAEQPAPELLERLAAAQRLAATPLLPPEKVSQELGGGHAAEEALAVGLYSVLATADGPDGPRTPQEHARAAIVAAVASGTAGHSTGSVAGSILGALYGDECLPVDWLDALEGRDEIRGLVDQLLKVTVAPE